MEYADITALREFHQSYQAQKQIIADRLREDIELFRAELGKFNPHSKCEVERWNFGIYQTLLQRRSRLLQTLFEAAT